MEDEEEEGFVSMLQLELLKKIIATTTTATTTESEDAEKDNEEEAGEISEHQENGNSEGDAKEVSETQGTI